VASESAAIDIAAPAERVWEVILDVESWPRWSPSMTSVRRLDGGRLRVGSRARIKQPRLPVLVWQVTDLDEGAAFTWVARSPGLSITAIHEVSAAPGGSRLTLTVAWTGPLAALATMLASKRTRRSLAQETSGAKARSESAG
jgi:uncharacterized membrane protein